MSPGLPLLPSIMIPLKPSERKEPVSRRMGVGLVKTVLGGRSHLNRLLAMWGALYACFGPLERVEEACWDLVDSRRF